MPEVDARQMRRQWLAACARAFGFFGSNHRLLIGQLFELNFNIGHILVPGIGKQIRLKLAKRFALNAVANPAQVGKLVSQRLDFVIFAVDFGLFGLQEYTASFFTCSSNA